MTTLPLHEPPPENPPAASPAALRIPLLHSKMLEYDGQVTKEETLLFSRMFLTRGLWKNFGNSLSLCAWWALPFFLYWAFEMARDYVHFYGPSALIHPDFIFTLAAFSLIVLLLTSYFALIHNLITTKSSFLYPDSLYLSPEGFAFGAEDRLIPWSKVLLVHKRKMILGRRRHTNILEIYLPRQPYQIKLKPWQWWGEYFSTRAFRNDCLLFDPATHKFPDNPYEGLCLRVPLELFGFDADCQKFLKALKANIPAEALPEDLEISGPVASSQSFTALWLDELRLSKNNDTRRLLEVGQHLGNGRYEVTGVLGYGGFSVVYSARSIGAAGGGTEQSVAIKELVINSGGSRSSKEAILKQIVAEIDLLKALDHPNIVKCLDYFIDGGRIYIVMQAIEGKNLRDWITQKGPLSQEDLIEIGRQSCAILSYLHERSQPLIHRDFTPDNLIWDGRTVKLIDFNVAEETNTSTSPTIVGKHSYLAPEQWCGTFTEKGDLYQLGCSLYFLATGQDPEAISQSDPANLHPQLSPHFCKIVRTLTETDPARRYNTARDTGLQFQSEQGA